MGVRLTSWHASESAKLTIHKSDTGQPSAQTLAVMGVAPTSQTRVQEKAKGEVTVIKIWNCLRLGYPEIHWFIKRAIWGVYSTGYPIFRHAHISIKSSIHSG